MKAVYFEEYGGYDKLELKEIPIPIPKANQILVKNHASSINFGNIAHIKGAPKFIRVSTGFRKPRLKIPGGDVAGTVADVGSSVKSFKKGDEVMGDVSDTGFGAYAEYVLVKEKNLVAKPSNISFESAACLPLGAGVAYEAMIVKGHLKKGMKVLIVGATGSIGIFALQIAKQLETIVTAVCSADKQDIVRGLGADKVIDYKSTSLSSLEERYDLIVGIAGDTPMKVYKSLLNVNGVFVNVGGDIKQFRRVMTTAPIQFFFSSKKLRSLTYLSSKSTLAEVALLAEQGIIKPVIDKVFNLEDITEALQYYESHRAIGKIVIKISKYE